jgi:hypothetical protein
MSNPWMVTPMTRTPALLLTLLVATLLSACRSTKPAHAAVQPSWRGVHLFVQSNEAADSLTENLPKLAAIGVNAVVVEVNFSYDFKSHPELRNRNFITREHAQKLAAAARRNGIRLIPELDCLSHQSGRRSNLPLLEKYPEFGEPVGDNTDKDGAHLRSWCPQHPDVNRVVCQLIDELVEAFQADAFHVGMDEVFCVASDRCARCRGGDPAHLFAKAVNDLHKHIVGRRKWEMLMWGDRLLDAKTLGYSKWEASKNGTEGAIDLIPKDIIVCDWHYEKRDSYPSVPLLLQKGFRVWPSGWQPLEATKAFSAFALRERQKNPRLVGYLCTAWGKIKPAAASEWPPMVEVLKEWKE